VRGRRHLRERQDQSEQQGPEQAPVHCAVS
jgi:hypothetical protein